MHPHSTHPLDEAVTWLEHLERQRRALDAARLRLIAASLDQVTAGAVSTEAPGSGAEREMAYRALRAEFALALNLSEHQVERQMHLAHQLAHCYPAAFEMLDSGAISFEHARVIADAGVVIGAGHDADTLRRRRGYETEVSEAASRETPNRFRPIVRRLAEQWAEHDLPQRHSKAASARGVMVVGSEDGMADLIAHLPALEAYAIHDRLTRIARAAECGERTVRDLTPTILNDAASGDAATERPVRSRDQLRADAFADLLLGDDEHSLLAGTTAEAIRGRVQLIVTGADRGGGGTGDAGTEAGSDAGEDTLAFESSELDAYGPIPPAAAERVAARTAQWDRVMIDTATGEVLRVDRYRPSERIRRMLSARDRTCRFPGCRTPVHRCDLDHTVDAAKGGSTSTDNLAFLCRGHHMLKHHSGWRVHQRAGGILHWISPTGRRYVDRPSDARSRRRPPSGRGSGGSPIEETTAGSAPGSEAGAGLEPLATAPF